MRKPESDETIVALAVSKSKSVRSTIPKHIAKKLDLKPGVCLKWDVDKVDGEWVIVIHKVPTAGG